MSLLRLAREFRLQTSSVAVPPDADFVAYSDGGVVFDNGKKRFLRGSARRLTTGADQVVRAATPDAIVFTDRRHLSVVDLDGDVRQLAPCDSHVPLALDAATDTLTFTLGPRVLQYDTSSWTLRRSIDLSEQFDVAAFTAVAANADWIVLRYGARFAVLNDADEVEIALPSDDRGNPQLGPGDVMLAPYHKGEHTMLSELPDDREREVWDDWRWTRWCALAEEYRAVNGSTVLVRTPSGDVTRHTGELPDDPGFTQAMYTMFADRAPRCVRWGYNTKSFYLLEWS